MRLSVIVVSVLVAAGLVYMASTGVGLVNNDGNNTNRSRGNSTDNVSGTGLAEELNMSTDNVSARDIFGAVENVTENRSDTADTVLNGDDRLSTLKHYRSLLYEKRSATLTLRRELRDRHYNGPLGEQRYNRAGDVLMRNKDNLTSEIRRVDDAVDTLERQVEAEEERAQHEERLEELESERDDLQERLGDVGNSIIDAQQSKLDNIGTNLTALEERLDSLRARDTEITKQLQSVKEEIGRRRGELAEADDIGPVTYEPTPVMFELHDLRMQLVKNIVDGEEVSSLLQREEELEANLTS